MALRIRLARGGAKKRPFYRMVVAENTSPRDGKFVERVGSYNPLIERGKDGRVVADIDRVKYWLSVGAKATERVEKLLAGLGIVPQPPIRVTPQKSAPKKKAQERAKAAREAQL
jgi:small subunit ribosomal protein S16